MSKKPTAPRRNRTTSGQVVKGDYMIRVSPTVFANIEAVRARVLRRAARLYTSRDTAALWEQASNGLVLALICGLAEQYMDRTEEGKASTAQATFDF
jgi:hypothetical protein